ncbi:MAG: recombinase family protein [Oscillospiraceae bacterium]
MCSIPPYGYIRDPEDKRHWLVDEAAAEVVRKIFELYLGGMGTKMIADFLEENGILTPTDHLKSLGKKPRGTY